LDVLGAGRVRAEEVPLELVDGGGVLADIDASIGPGDDVAGDRVVPREGGDARHGDAELDVARGVGADVVPLAQRSACADVQVDAGVVAAVDEDVPGSRRRAPDLYPWRLRVHAAA